MSNDRRHRMCDHDAHTRARWNKLTLCSASRFSTTSTTRSGPTRVEFSWSVPMNRSPHTKTCPRCGSIEDRCMSKDERPVGDVVREPSTTWWGDISSRDRRRMEMLATRSRDTSNTYLSSPMTWSELRERYPSQNIDLRNICGEWRSFTTAQVGRSPDPC